MAVPTIQITGSVVSPDGAVLTSGVIVAELSQPGSAMDGAVSVRVLGKISATITAGAVAADLDLVPNDAITPAGTYYRVTIFGTTADGQVYRSAVPEKWQLASSPASVDIGAVTRIEGSPPAVVYPGLPAFPLSQANGGSGATTLSAASVTPTGGAADSLADHLAAKVTASGGDGSAVVVTPQGGGSPVTLAEVAANAAAGASDVVPSSLAGTPVDGYVPSKSTGADTWTWVDPGGSAPTADALTFYDPGARRSPFTHPGSGLVITAARGTRGAYWNGNSIAWADPNLGRVDAAAGLLVEGGAEIAPWVSDPEEWSPTTANWSTLTLTTVYQGLAGRLGGSRGVRLKGANATTSRIACRLHPSGAIPAGTYTFSVWVRAVDISGMGSTYVGVAVPELAIFDAHVSVNAYMARTDAVMIGGEWRRLSLTFTAIAGHDYYANIMPGRFGGGATGDVFVCHPQLELGSVARSWHPWAHTRGRDIVTTPAADAVKVPSGSGYLRVVPEWGSANAGSDRTILETTGFKLEYLYSAATWKLTVGGQSVTAPSYAFYGGTERYLRWRYTVGQPLFFSADWQTEGQSAGNVTSFSPTGPLYLGCGAAASADVGIRDIFFDAANTVRAWAVTENDDHAVCIGDSITNGAYHTTAYPATLARSTGRKVINAGFGWATSANILATWRTEHRGQGVARLSILGGINDVIADASAATIEANLQSVITEALADGVDVAVLTLLPFRGYSGWSAGRQAILESVNTWIRALAGVTVIDTYADMGDSGGGGADYMLPAYRAADYLHIQQAGADRIATLVGAWMGNAS